MKKLGIVFKAIIVVCYVYLFQLTAKTLSTGEITLPILILYIVGWGTLFNYCFKVIMSKILRKFIQYIYYKNILTRYKSLEDAYKTRYKLYFTGTQEDVDKLSKSIIISGMEFCEIVNNAYKYRLVSEKNLQEIPEMIEKVSEMMSDNSDN